MYKVYTLYMIKISAKQARDDFSATLDKVRVEHERIVVQRNGRDIAALVSIDDLELLERLEDEADIRAAREALKDPERYPLEEVLEGLGLGKKTKKR
jgi:prevent-host-death family protein